MDEKMPKVGLGVIILKEGQVLMHQRKGAHGAGSWSFPGGHLEFGETFEAGAKRETLEEAGIEIENVAFATATNDIMKDEGKHYVTVFVTADWKAGEPKVLEPDKCVEWRWVEWDEMPKPLFKPVENLKASGFEP